MTNSSLSMATSIINSEREILPKSVPLKNKMSEVSCKISSERVAMMEFIYDKYITNHLTALPPNIPEIAKEINMSNSVFKKTFKYYFNKAFYQAYLDAKMDFAKVLLRQGFKGCNVSNMLNYSAPIKFNKQFQKHFSITPNNYRKLHKHRLNTNPFSRQ